MSGIVSPECLSVVWNEGGDTRQRRVRFAEERVMICYKVETPLFCECVCALNDTGWRSRAGGNFQSLICPASRGVRALTNCFPFVSRPGLIDSVDVRLVPCSSSSSNLLVLFLLAAEASKPTRCCSPFWGWENQLFLQLH